ncbi:tetraspanin-33-like [Rhipicephalus microplus]|uniref:tetraspanin-33-like n=1 Tax=Rhipicephalus microplus TaxID=6941 RepID=UPI003F6CE76E
MAKIGSTMTIPETISKTGALLMSNRPPSTQLYASGRNIETTDELSSTVFVDVNAYLRLPLVFVNMLVMLLGLLGFWSSLYALVTDSSVPPGAPSRNFVVVLFQRPEIPAFFISTVVFSIAAVGFLGALRENVTLLTAYVHLLTVLAILQALASVLVFYLPSWARTYVAQSVSQDMIAAYRDDVNLQSFVDWMQVEYRCCGISTEGFRDWNHNPYFACNKTNDSRERCAVPPSCCRQNETSDAAGRLPNVMCARNVLQVSDQVAWARIYTRSCSDALFSRMQDRVMPASMIMLGLCLVTLLLASLAIGTREQVLMLDAIYGIYYRSERACEILGIPGHRSAETLPTSSQKLPPNFYWELP